MSRSLRIEYEGAFYHVIQRGTERKNVFKEDRDKKRLLKYINIAHERYQILIHSYCVMDNHYHFLIETPQANIAKTMHYINASYAIYYNTKYRRVGPLFQGRYKSVLVEADEYLHYVSKYIHLNPVKAKKVKNPVEYKWSSCSYYLNNEVFPKWLEKERVLGYFGSGKRERIRRYKEFLEMEDEVDITKENTYKGVILGDKGFIDAIVRKYIDEVEDNEVPSLKRLKRIKEVGRYEIEKIIRRYERNEKEIRKILIYMIRKKSSKSLKEIAEEIGGISYWGVGKICKRMDGRLEKTNVYKTIRKVEKDIALIMSKVQT